MQLEMINVCWLGIVTFWEWKRMLYVIIIFCALLWYHPMNPIYLSSNSIMIIAVVID